MKKITYPLSVLFLLVSFFLIIEFPNSGRFNLIAGILTAIGFSLNIMAFAMKKEVLK